MGDLDSLLQDFSYLKSLEHKNQIPKKPPRKLLLPSPRCVASECEGRGRGTRVGGAMTGGGQEEEEQAESAGERVHDRLRAGDTGAGRGGCGASTYEPRPPWRGGKHSLLSSCAGCLSIGGGVSSVHHAVLRQFAKTGEGTFDRIFHRPLGRLELLVCLWFSVFS